MVVWPYPYWGQGEGRSDWCSGYSNVVSKPKSWVQFDLKEATKEKKSTIIGPLCVVSKQSPRLREATKYKN